MPITTTLGQCHIVELKPPYERLEIQFVPAEFSLQSNANNAKIEVVGRNNPRFHYTGGDDKLSFQLDFYSDDQNRQDVITKCKWLQALRYNDGFNGPKRNISVVMGDLFRNQIWIVDSVSIKYSSLDGKFRFLPKQAYVDISLSLDPDKNLTIADVRRI